MNIRTVVQTHLGRERLDVLVAVLVPLVLMIESGYANAWVFAGGHLGLDLNSFMALGRGLFLEALIYACFKLVRVFVLKGGRSIVVALVPLSLGIVTMIISAGCNLGWMSQSPEMKNAFQAVALCMPGWMGDLFRTGLGLIFPVGVGVFALLDVSHLVDDLLRSTAHLDNRALHVVRSDIHRTGFLRELKKAAKKAQSQYKQICEADADNMVTKVRNGDLSFDTDKLRELPAPQSSVTRINPAPTTPFLPSGGPVPFQQPPINGQFGPASPYHSGTTQQIHVPAASPPSQP